MAMDTLGPRVKRPVAVFVSRCRWSGEGVRKIDVSAFHPVVLKDFFGL